MGTIGRGLGLLLVLAVAWVFLVLAMGIPASWIRLAERRLPAMPFAAEAAAISYDPFRGVVMKEARIYHKGDVGRPLVSADSVRLAVNPLALLAGGEWIQEIRITDGVIRALNAPAAPSGMVDLGRRRFRIELRDTRIFGERLARGSAVAEMNGDKVRLDRLQADIGEADGPQAVLQGSLALDLGARRYKASAAWTGNPQAVEPFLTDLGRTAPLPYLRLFQPGAKPATGELEIEGGYGADWAFSMAFSGSARDCRFRETAIRNLFVALQFRSGAGHPSELSFDPVVLIRQDGLAAGGVTVDFGTGDIRFDGYSTCPPAVLARLVDPEAAKPLSGLRSEGPFRIHAGGTLNVRDLGRNAVTMFVEGRKLGLGGFEADRLGFTARLNGTSCEIHDLAGECYGGAFTGRVDGVASWTPEKRLARVQFAVQGGFRGLDIRGVAAAVGRPMPDRYEGRLSLNGTVSGAYAGGAWRDMGGQGQIRIDNGRLFRLPVFTPVSEFFRRLAPGADPEAGLTGASADWRLEEGRIRSSRIVVEGPGVNVSGRGALTLPDQLDYDIQFQLMGSDSLLGRAVRAVTFPVSKLFEFRLRGTPVNPRWSPVNFSSDLFEKRDRGAGRSAEGGAP